MSSFAPFVAAGRYRLNPGQQLTFTTDVGTTLMNDAPGLFTGQLSVDQILQAMDVAWKQGPS